MAFLLMLPQDPTGKQLREGKVLVTELGVVVRQGLLRRFVGRDQYFPWRFAGFYPALYVDDLLHILLSTIDIFRSFFVDFDRMCIVLPCMSRMAQADQSTDNGWVGSILEAHKHRNCRLIRWGEQELLSRIRNWVGKESRGGKRTQPARVPSFEQLEPRLLLSADFVGTEPTVPLEVPQTRQVIFVDLTPADREPQRNLSAVLTVDLTASSRTSDADFIDLQVLATDSGQEGSGNELTEKSQPPTEEISGVRFSGFDGSRDGSRKALAAAPVLPGLRLINPDPGNLPGQVIYLDFDGAEKVVYNGPVTVSPLDIPRFQAPGRLAAQEQQIIAQVISELEQAFAGSGVIFTTDKPCAGQPYSTIYIGGGDSAFAQYGSFLGLAEQVDVGNEEALDEAFVFSARLAETAGDSSRYAAGLAQLIAHEAGHLLGYEHQASTGPEEGLLHKYAADEPLIVDHNGTDITQIPESAIAAAKANLHIAYGHTSHGSQLTTGMSGLVSFANNGGLGLTLPDNMFAYNSGGTGGALDLRDSPFSGAYDLGNPNRTAWATATRNYLAAHPEVNVILWSWCGQAATTIANIDIYLNLMEGLVADYPSVQFVFMTGHLDGTGSSGLLNLANEHMREHCRQNNRILYDFADIESYDPDGGINYMPLGANDNCDYDSNGDGTRDKNWAIDWQNAHTQGADWYSCTSAHSQPLNANRKAYAAWWLWARLAGWDGVPSGDSNAAPVLAVIGNKSVDEGQLLTFTASATDSDLPANTLTFSLLNAPAGASIDPASGVFTWTPSEGQGPATYNLTVRVTDNGTPNLHDEETIIVTVLQIPGSPVYRFWSPVHSRHFYTMDETERDKLINNYSHVWTSEGVVYQAYADDTQPGVAPIYRFWSGTLNAHFYTMNQTERDKLINDYSHAWTYEGVAFYAYTVGSQPEGTRAVYRFWSGTLNCHFYTMDQDEKDKLINLYSHVWTYEQIAWYAYGV